MEALLLPLPAAAPGGGIGDTARRAVAKVVVLHPREDTVHERIQQQRAPSEKRRLIRYIISHGVLLPTQP